MKFMVRQVVGEGCLTIEDGRRLYKQFIPELQAGREVELDFRGVAALDTPFFNSSLGFLLRDFEPQDLSRLVKVFHLDSAAQKLLHRVLNNCRRYYQGLPELHNLVLVEASCAAAGGSLEV